MLRWSRKDGVAFGRCSWPWNLQQSSAWESLVVALPCTSVRLSRSHGRSPRSWDGSGRWPCPQSSHALLACRFQRTRTHDERPSPRQPAHRSQGVEAQAERDAALARADRVRIIIRDVDHVPDSEDGPVADVLRCTLDGLHQLQTIPALVGRNPGRKDQSA